MTAAAVVVSAMDNGASQRRTAEPVDSKVAPVDIKADEASTLDKIAASQDADKSDNEQKEEDPKQQALDNINEEFVSEMTKELNELMSKLNCDLEFQYHKEVNVMSVKMVDTDQFVSDLSGGNKQKVVLARWIGKDSDILVLDSPTRGIDIKVKQDIYQLMDRMRKNGKSIIMISEELMELIGMCDRILIMKDGRINGELHRSRDLDENSLIARMV
jgi:ABC-type sugar transport system ATPase subunit